MYGRVNKLPGAYFAPGSPDSTWTFRDCQAMRAPDIPIKQRAQDTVQAMSTATKIWFPPRLTNINAGLPAWFSRAVFSALGVSTS